MWLSLWNVLRLIWKLHVIWSTSTTRHCKVHEYFIHTHAYYKIVSMISVVSYHVYQTLQSMYLTPNTFYRIQANLRVNPQASPQVDHLGFHPVALLSHLPIWLTRRLVSIYSRYIIEQEIMTWSDNCWLFKIRCRSIFNLLLILLTLTILSSSKRLVGMGYTRFISNPANAIHFMNTVAKVLQIRSQDVTILYYFGQVNHSHTSPSPASLSLSSTTRAHIQVHSYNER